MVGLEDANSIQLHSAGSRDKQGTNPVGGMTGILPSIGRVSDGEGSSDRYRRRRGNDGVYLGIRNVLDPRARHCD